MDEREGAPGSERRAGGCSAGWEPGWGTVPQRSPPHPIAPHRSRRRADYKHVSLPSTEADALDRRRKEARGAGSPRAVPSAGVGAGQRGGGGPLSAAAAGQSVSEILRRPLPDWISSLPPADGGVQHAAQGERAAVQAPEARPQPGQPGPEPRAVAREPRCALWCTQRGRQPWPDACAALGAGACHAMRQHSGLWQPAPCMRQPADDSRQAPPAHASGSAGGAESEGGDGAAAIPPEDVQAEVQAAVDAVKVRLRRLLPRLLPPKCTCADAPARRLAGWLVVPARGRGGAAGVVGSQRQPASPVARRLRPSRPRASTDSTAPLPCPCAPHPPPLAPAQLAKPVGSEVCLDAVRRLRQLLSNYDEPPFKEAVAGGCPCLSWALVLDLSACRPRLRASAACWRVAAGSLGDGWRR